MHVVLLLGSSTAGKSMLCRELVANHNWQSDSTDEVLDKYSVELSAMLAPLILERLNKQDLIASLQSLMTEDEVIKLANTGKLTISTDDHTLVHQFKSPELNELEEVLKKGGFKIESEIPEIATSLRLVTKIGDDSYSAIPFPNLMKRLYDETFIKSNSEKSIVLDVVPDLKGSAKESVEEFERHAQHYRDENPGETLTTSVVVAYCPPQTLSERIQKRNQNAKEKDPTDERHGLFPFYQLAQLVTADKKFDTDADKLSKTELFYMINRHAATDNIKDSLFLENPVDFEALHDITSKKPPLTTSEAGVVKLQLQDDELSLPFSDSDQPRIGSKKTIEEYRQLADKFGFTEQQEHASLSIRDSISYDAIINTSEGTPEELANTFIQKLEKKTSEASLPQQHIPHSLHDKITCLNHDVVINEQEYEAIVYSIAALPFVEREKTLEDLSLRVMKKEISPSLYKAFMTDIPQVQKNDLQTSHADQHQVQQLFGYADYVKSCDKIIVNARSESDTFTKEVSFTTLKK